jgi:Tfp pilus assembly protein PilE
MTSRHFTLVELLTVTVVMTIIIGATVSAYNHIMTGNAVSYGNRLITSELNMARTYACQKRRAIAVLFTSPDITYNPDVDEPVALRAYRCAYVEKSGSDWNFVEWVEQSQWKFLPRGAFFATTDATQSDAKDADHGFRGSATVKDVYDGILKSDGTSIQESENPLFHGKKDFKFAVIFRRNGRPVTTNGSPRVQVRQGVVTGNTDDEGMIAKLNADNYLVAQLNRYTGAVVTKSPEDY